MFIQLGCSVKRKEKAYQMSDTFLQVLHCVNDLLVNALSSFPEKASVKVLFVQLWKLKDVKFH